jgi:hypothetical protein
MRVRFDDQVQDKLDANVFQSLFLTLADMRETGSKESQEREAKKRRQANVIVDTSIPHSIPEELSSAQKITTPSLPFDKPRFPVGNKTPDNKRNVSDTSFDAHSTETTPTKLVHPEAKVQSLQNEFVKIILSKLWWGQIDITWAKGRHMFLTYTEYLSPHSLLMVEL